MLASITLSSDEAFTHALILEGSELNSLEEAREVVEALKNELSPSNHEQPYHRLLVRRCDDGKRH
jgi:hypothetical protein